MTRLHHLTTALTLVCCAGMCWAQPTARVSGLLHTGLGGATFDPPVGRRLHVHNLGSSGNDGVEIQTDAAAGAVFSADFGPLMRTPGARCTAQAIGGGAPLGQVRMTGFGGGRCAVLGDFSSVGAISVKWVVRDTTGHVMAQGTRSGAFLECVLADAGAAGQGVPSEWSLARTGTPDRWSWDLKSGTKGRMMSVTGLAPTPLVGVGEIEMRPILCITSPCPGDGTTMSAMRVTAGGLPSFTVQDASLIRSCVIAPGSETGPGGAFIVNRGLAHWGSTDVAIAEGCDLPPPLACAPVERTLHVSQFGPSGVEGVTFDLGSCESLAADGVIHRDLAARSVAFDMVVRPGGGAGGAPGGELTIKGNGKKNYVGHVTLIKQRVAYSPGGGMPIVKFDPTERGSTQTRVECLSQDGSVVASAIVEADEGVQIPGCMNPDLSMTLKCELTADGASIVRCCSPSSEVVLPSGAVISGVERVRFTPVAPTVPAGVLDELSVTGDGLESVDITRVEVGTPIWAGGLAVEGVGHGTPRKTVDGGLEVLNIGSSGQDGVSVHIDARKGGRLTVDLSPLEAAPSGELRLIGVKVKSWVDQTSQSVTLTRTAAGIEEVNDFSGIQATEVSWRLLSSSGRVLASGVAPGPVVTWTLGVDSASPGISKSYAFSTQGAARSANEGFFDRVVTVSGLTPVPVSGVAGIAVSAVSSVGGGGGGASAAAYAATGRVIVTGTNIGTLHLGCAIECDGPRDADSDGDMVPDDVFASGVGNGVVASVVEAGETKLEISNLGSSGQDGVSLVHRALDTGGSLEFGLTSSYTEAKSIRKQITINLRAHQQDTALCRFTEESEAGGTGRTLVKWTSGSWACREVSFFDGAGQLLHTATVPVDDALAISPRDGEQLDRWTVSGNAVKLEFATAPVQVALSGGGITISQVRWIVVGGDAVAGSPLGAANNVQILARGQDPVKLGGCILRPPLNMRGVPIRTKLKTYGLVLADQGGRVLLQTPAATPTEPLEKIACTVVCDTEYGRSVAFDATELLVGYGGPGGGPNVRIIGSSAKGVAQVGLNARATATPGQLAHTCDYTSSGATSVRWTLRGAGGQVLGQGEAPGAVIDWTGDVTSLSPTAPVSIECSSRREKWIEVMSYQLGVARVSGSNLPTTDGVVSIEFEPVFANGAPAPSLLAAIDLEAEGLSSLLITDAASETFGVKTKPKPTKLYNWVKDAYDRVTGQTALQCETDGESVELEIFPPRSVDDLSVSTLRPKTGHVSLIKFIDDAEQETGRLTQTGDDTGLHTTSAADFTAGGATGVEVYLHDASNNIIATFPCAPGYQVAVERATPECPSGTSERVRKQKSWVLANFRTRIEHRFCAPAVVTLPGGGTVSEVFAISYTPTADYNPATKNKHIVISVPDDDGILGARRVRLAITGVEAVDSEPRCNPADIAFDDGSPLPPVGVSGSTNNGVTEGDYNLFFATYFDAGSACDIANDDGSPLPPFGSLETNNGVTEGDYNLFFSIYFDGCSL
jgi:hypothetical protein